MDAREKGFFPGRQSEGEDFVETVGQKILGVFDDRGGGGGQFGRQSALDGELCAQFPGRAVFQFYPGVGVQDEHRIGEGIQRGFHGMMQPDDLFSGALAIGVQLGGHFVERVGQFAQFIVRKDGHDQIESALADLARRAG